MNLGPVNLAMQQIKEISFLDLGVEDNNRRQFPGKIERRGYQYISLNKHHQGNSLKEGYQDSKIWTASLLHTVTCREPVCSTVLQVPVCFRVSHVESQSAPECHM